MQEEITITLTFRRKPVHHEHDPRTGKGRDITAIILDNVTHDGATEVMLEDTYSVFEDRAYNHERGEWL